MEVRRDRGKGKREIPQNKLTDCRIWDWARGEKRNLKPFLDLRVDRRSPRLPALGRSVGDDSLTRRVSAPPRAEGCHRPGLVRLPKGICPGPCRPVVDSSTRAGCTVLAGGRESGPIMDTDGEREEKPLTHEARPLWGPRSRGSRTCTSWSFSGYDLSRVFQVSALGVTLTGQGA